MSPVHPPTVTLSGNAPPTRCFEQTNYISRDQPNLPVVIYGGGTPGLVPPPTDSRMHPEFRRK